MKIIGYYICGKKEYVAFVGKDKGSAGFRITDGFHDKSVSERDADQYKRVRKEDIDLKKIIGRMHGTRPWHPLLKTLEKEAAI